MSEDKYADRFTGEPPSWSLTEGISQGRLLSHIVLDLETLGVRDNPVILAVGAVALDDEYKVIGRFYRSVHGAGQYGRTMDYSTVKWWVTRTSDDARNAAFHDNAVRLTQAVDDFGRWILDYTEHDAEVWGVAAPVQFWGKGPEFDNVIWRSALEGFSAREGTELLQKVWTYRNNQSLRTVELLAESLGITVEVPDTGIVHHALCDAEWEAEYLRQAMHKILALAPKALDTGASSK